MAIKETFEEKIEKVVIKVLIKHKELKKSRLIDEVHKIVKVEYGAGRPRIMAAINRLEERGEIKKRDEGAAVIYYMVKK